MKYVYAVYRKDTGEILYIAQAMREVDMLADVTDELGVFLLEDENVRTDTHVVDLKTNKVVEVREVKLKYKDRRADDAI